MIAFAVRVEFHPGALDDIFEAGAEYESRRSLLGERFVAAVTSAADRLEELPRKGPVLLEAVRGSREYRGVRVGRFPYKLIYGLHDGSVLVMAVWHDRRRPLGWLHRT